MSQMGGISGPSLDALGTARIDFIGNDAGLAESTRNATASMNEFGKSTERSFLQQASAATRLVASIAAIGFSIEKVTAAVREFNESGATLAKAFDEINSVGGLRGMAQSGDQFASALAKINEQAAQLQKTIGEESSSKWYSFKGLAERFIQELYDVQDADQRASEQLERTRARAIESLAALASDAAEKSANTIREAAEKAMMDERQLATKAAEDKLAELDRLEERARTESAKKSIESARKYVAEELRFRLRAMDERDRIEEEQRSERERKDAESAIRASSAITRAISSDIASIRGQIGDIFRFDGSSIAEIQNLLRTIAQNVRREK